VPKRDEDGGFTGVVFCWPAEAAARAVVNEKDEVGWICCWMAGAWGCCRPVRKFFLIFKGIF
jgi:hypothetical protein